MTNSTAAPEAFSRVVIDAQLKDAGWTLTDDRSVRFEVMLADGTKADYVLGDRHGRALAVLEAKRGLTVGQHIASTFLRRLLQAAHSFLLSKVRESARGTKKLDTAVLTTFLTIVPPLSLQTAFAEQANRLEATARALDTVATKAEAMAAGLSAEIFKTGSAAALCDAA